MSQYEPVYDTINPDPPTEQDRLIDETLFAFSSKEIQLESEEEMQHRNAILAEVKRIFQEWVRYVATEVVCLPEEEAQEAGGQLFVSGSHRLGVREPGADIDTVCVAPRFCMREHFFSSLKDKLQNNPEITNLNAIPGAAVPIMSFDFQGVSIDLLFARLPDNSVPQNIDIFDDKILRNLDTASEKSLNGPRVTYMISRLVPNFENFLIVLRCIRKWAKRKGLYGNKLGYFGGINLNILVAFVCQLYPNASPSSLLGKFFKVYSQWQWPNPIMLNRIQRIPHNDEIWSKEAYPYHLMPIITPSYPAMNSAVSVSLHTRKAIQTEIRKGYEIIQNIIKNNGLDWSNLFTPSDFFIRYSHYLCCHIIGIADDEVSRSWIGFVESRIRKLPELMSQLPILPIHLYPIQFPTKKSDLSICYFIGFNIDNSRLRSDDKNLHIDRCVNDFRNELSRFNGEKREGLAFTVEHFTWRQLPEEVFDSLGGKQAAKAMRLVLRPKPITATTTAVPVPATTAVTQKIVSVEKDVVSTVPVVDGDVVGVTGDRDSDSETKVKPMGMDLDSQTGLDSAESKSMAEDDLILKTESGQEPPFTSTTSSEAAGDGGEAEGDLGEDVKKRKFSETQDHHTPSKQESTLSATNAVPGGNESDSIPKLFTLLKYPKTGSSRPHRPYNVHWNLLESTTNR
eukprot:gene3025-5929_t